MAMMSPMSDLVQAVGPRLPLLLVYLVGIVLALTTWGRHSTASLLSLLGFVLFIFGSLLGMASSWYVVHGAADLDMSDRMLWLNVSSYLGTGMGVIGWVLILTALFARRPQAPELWARPSSGRGGLDLTEREAPPGPASRDIRR